MKKYQFNESLYNFLIKSSKNLDKRKRFPRIWHVDNVKEDQKEIVIGSCPQGKVFWILLKLKKGWTFLMNKCALQINWSLEDIFFSILGDAEVSQKNIEVLTRIFVECLLFWR